MAHHTFPDRSQAWGEEIARLPPEATHVLIVANPTAGAPGRRQLVDDLQRLLQTQGFRVQRVTEIATLSALAEEKLRNGTLRCVLAAGGDGTAAQVANRTPPGTPVALLPLGTENLLAKYLRLSPEPRQINQIIRDGELVHLDAGSANGRVFLLMVGCGFDAHVVRRLHETRTGHIRHWSYVKPILSAIRSYQYPAMRVYCGNSEDTVNTQPSITAKWVFTFNLPCYAGGLGIAPWAEGRDGALDVCAFTRGSLLRGLVYLTGIVLGRHRTWRDCVTAQARWLRIESDVPVPYQVDGDPGGDLPLTIHVLPKRLTLLVPKPCPTIPPPSVLTSAATASRCC